jgi:hypothetical protein
MNLVSNTGYRCPIMQDDSLILIKATSSRVWSWWPIPTQNNGIHSTGYYVGGIFHTHRQHFPYFLFHRLYQCPHAWKYFSPVPQNVMKHQGFGNVMLENKAKCTNCKIKFHSSQNSGDCWILKRKIVPVFSASNENGRWITKVFNFDTRGLRWSSG